MPAARRSSATTSRSPAFTRWLSRLSLIIGLAAGLHALDTVRAQTPGSLDTGFAATTDGGVVSLAVQPDGKVLLDGKFTQVNGEAHFSIARLNGSTSATFFTGRGGALQRRVLPGLLGQRQRVRLIQLPLQPSLPLPLHLGFEYVTDALDGEGGVYLYDFAGRTFFYTSPTLPVPLPVRLPGPDQSGKV